MGQKYGYGKYQRRGVNKFTENEIRKVENGERNQAKLPQNGSPFLTTAVMWVIC